MEKYIFLKPMFATAIWGDGRLVHRYHLESYVPLGMDINEITGIQAFSGYPSDSNLILSGECKGMNLAQVYELHPELFGTPHELRWEHIPVSMGIAHACADLSIQVHPTEGYAMTRLRSHGKSESWYFVDCPKDGEIVMGHTATSMEELLDYVKRNDWDHLLKRYPIKPGGFYNIQAGTLHAIQAGTTFMEVCNPSPVTYRFYDYDREDQCGNKRELHIEKAKENVIIPYQENLPNPIITEYGEVQETVFTDNPNFSVFRYVVKGEGLVPKKKPYLGAFIIEGEGMLEDIALHAGDSILITSQVNELKFKGAMTILAYHG